MTIGQVFYEAMIEKFTTFKCPWEQIPEDSKEHYERGARAVEAQVQADIIEAISIGYVNEYADDIREWLTKGEGKVYLQERREYLKQKKDRDTE